MLAAPVHFVVLLSAHRFSPRLLPVWSAIMRASCLFAVVGILSAVPASGRAQARPCTTPTTACERWVPLGGGSGKSMVYATHALDNPNTAITRALIMVHGAGRNADHYFATSTAAGFLAGALDNTIIISPRLSRLPTSRSQTKSCGRTAATVGDRGGCRPRIPPSGRSTSSTSCCASWPTRRLSRT